MNLTSKTLSLVCVVLITLSGTVALGQHWVEVGDAPADIPMGQETVGVGPLLNIRGGTDTSLDDWVDVYSISVTDPLEFYATTDETWGNRTGTSSFDTRLFLFNMDGSPAIANDDLVSAPPWQSLITDPRTFPNAVEPTAENLEPGMYLLAVTGWDNDPLDANGNILFSVTGSISTPNVALHGPNPDAGPYASWENTGETGDYIVELGGAEYYSVPEPSMAFLTAVGLLSVLGLRRRR